jgi:hypothetical protein
MQGTGPAQLITACLQMQVQQQVQVPLADTDQQVKFKYVRQQTEEVVRTNALPFMCKSRAEGGSAHLHTRVNEKLAEAPPFRMAPISPTPAITPIPWGALPRSQHHHSGSGTTGLRDGTSGTRSTNSPVDLYMRALLLHDLTCQSTSFLTVKAVPLVGQHHRSGSCTAKTYCKHTG